MASCHFALTDWQVPEKIGSSAYGPTHPLEAIGGFGTQNREYAGGTLLPIRVFDPEKCGESHWIDTDSHS